MAKDPFGRMAPLIERSRKLGAVSTAVVYPCSRDALAATAEAADQGLIDPVLIGPHARIRELAAAEKIDLSRFAMTEAPGPVESAQHAAAMVRSGEAAMLMKGSLHTDELMSVVVSREGGLRGPRRVSHAFLIDVPGHDRLFLVADAAVNIAPDLAVKRDIVQNTIELAHALGIAEPRVAVLSAMETVNPALPSTIDAAALAKMAERGQITGAIVDGPLAFDNAISAEAAKVKGIRSPVAGRPDILIVPGIEAGNILYKQLTYLAHALPAGVVLGARVPIVLTSRADSRASRIASCAIACLLAHHPKDSH